MLLARTTATRTPNADQPNVLTSAFASPVIVETEGSVKVNVFVYNDRTCMKCSVPVRMFFCASELLIIFKMLTLGNRLNRFSQGHQTGKLPS